MLVPRRWLCCAYLMAVLTLAGCYQSPRQKLMGRWYNADMSLRFRPDGVVLFNNLDGMARGRYFFTEDPQQVGESQGQRNLVLDVVRNGARQQYSFDATFLSDDRLRLLEVSMTAVDRPTDAIRQFALLRKAVEKPIVSVAGPR